MRIGRQKDGTFLWALALLALLALVALGAALAAPAAQKPQDRPYPHGEYTGDCTQCHTTEQWVPVKPGKDFTHSRAFPLQGAHAATPCRSCHVSLEFKKASTLCVSCHQDVHHGELGADCARCHTTKNFIDHAAEVRTHRATRFPLTGAHATLDCNQCHRFSPNDRLTFVNTPTDCRDCHLEDYEEAEDPNHVQAHFPKNCTLCHNTFSFEGAQFNHTLAGFPLDGSHKGLACTDCHTNGRFDGTPADCYSCHQADYQGATNPNHIAAGFGTNCSRCHDTRNWHHAKFNHPFPIYSGTHAGRWNNCSDCHTNPNTYADFTCLSCHPHSDKSRTDSHHDDVSGYRYDSRSCYHCHPNGRAEGGDD